MNHSTDKRILRIGVLRNGQIVEERLFRKRSDVTVGTSPRSTFVVPEIGRSVVLFEVKGGLYRLNYGGKMQGRVSVRDEAGDAVVDLQSPSARKLADRRADGFSLPLTEDTRGKLVVGSVTLLFQFVTPPPPATRLQLPANIRGGWRHGIDWRFSAALSGAMLLQAAMVLLAVNLDPPEAPQGMDALPEHIINLITQPRSVPKTVARATPEAPSSEAPPPAPVKPAPRPVSRPEHKAVPPVEPANTPPKGSTDGPAEHTAQVRRDAVDKTILHFLGTGVAGTGPGIVHTLAHGAPDVSMATAFQNAHGTAVATNDIVDRDRRPGQFATPGAIATLRAEELGGPPGVRNIVRTGDKEPEVKVHGDVTPTAPSDIIGTGKLDAAAIAATVRQHINSVKQCYERALKRDGALKGKIVLQFTVAESGRVSEVETVSDGIGQPEIAQCMGVAIRRWHFKEPDGGSVTVTFPFILAPSN